MGTWGYNPKDGDSQQDGTNEVIIRGVAMSLIELFEEKNSPHSHPWERVGIVQQLSIYHYKIPLSVLKKCIEYIDMLLFDQEWISGWRHPNAFVASATDFKDKLIKIIEKAETKEAFDDRKRDWLAGEFDLIKTPELTNTKRWGASERHHE